MALDLTKFIIPDGAPSGTVQAMKSSTFGEADMARLVTDIGWANYVDANYTIGAPLVLNAGNGYIATLTNDGLGVGSTTSQWPAGQTEPWDTVTNKLIGVNDGDMYAFRLGFTAQDGATASLVDISINIGGAIGDIWLRSASVAKGATIPTHVQASSEYFTGTTFIANGGTITLDASVSASTLSIWDIELMIHRNYIGT